MQNKIKITHLPIVLDRKATIYGGVDDGDTDIHHLFDDDNVILCSDGTNVEFCISPFFDDRRRPYSEIRIELNTTVKEFMEWTQGEDAYVDLFLIDANEIGIFITTQHKPIYEVHSIR